MRDLDLDVDVDVDEWTGAMCWGNSNNGKHNCGTYDNNTNDSGACCPADGQCRHSGHVCAAWVEREQLHNGRWTGLWVVHVVGDWWRERDALCSGRLVRAGRVQQSVL